MSRLPKFKSLYTYSLTLLVMVAFNIEATAIGKIRCFFTQPVNTAVSKGVQAQYLNNCMGDTIVAYINRSKYTLDIAVYNYTSTFPGIAAAVNSAFNRGVRVRWIYDSSSSNTGIPLLVSGVRRLVSPADGGDYSIMHNKFMVIDANSGNAADAVVWTGSSNWNSQQFNDDYNNAVAIQDQALAKAYRAHFNMMWGDTGIAPNLSASKFGQFKTDLGAHSFLIEGKLVELYFSPADGTNTKIQAAMNSANSDLYFSMSTFTSNSNATLLISKSTSGVYVAGVNDPSITSASPYTILTSGLGSNFKVHTGSGLYHHKFLIADASNKCSDPLVLTGSHNWTFSADTKNDENTLIIHDDTAANIYYQAFHADFTALGGTLMSIPDCTTGGSLLEQASFDMAVYPNPAVGSFFLKFQGQSPQFADVQVYDLNGRRVADAVITLNDLMGDHTLKVSNLKAGVYMIKIVNDAGVWNSLVTVLNQ